MFLFDAETKTGVFYSAISFKFHYQFVTFDQVSYKLSLCLYGIS